MTWVSGIGIYFVIWWTSLFLVLPFAVRRTAEPVSVGGSDPGAPVKIHFKVILIATTLVAALIWTMLDVILIFHLVEIPKYRWN